MRRLSNLKLQKLTLIACLLLSQLVNGCRNNLPKFKLCVALEDKTFGCADQRIPSEKEGKIYPYTPGWICMPPDDFKTITNHIINREKYIISLENRYCN